MSLLVISFESAMKLTLGFGVELIVKLTLGADDLRDIYKLCALRGVYFPSYEKFIFGIFGLSVLS